jgi:hypothetical protein
MNALMIKRNKLIMLVNNDKLYLVISNQKSCGNVIGTIPFNMTSVFDDFSYTIPVQVKKAQSNMLILPDYFFGNTLYPFTSEKRSIAEAFIQRKLSESFPTSPEMLNFFNYTYTRTRQDAGSLYAFFLQDPAFFKLYQWLIHAGIQPDRIITPAFIWQHMLGKNVKGALDRNLCLIHTLLTESHLYFFVHGNFLFSRSIKFPESVVDDSEKLDSLVYEITQSIYLFSQKVKSEINGFYLVSSVEAGLKKIDEKGLSERMEKDVQRIDIDRKEGRHSEEADNPLSGPLAAFSWHDLESEKILAISHRKVALGKAWDPVQRVGMITGLLVLLLLGSETFYLNSRNNNKFLSETLPIAKDIIINRQIIMQYNELLDTVMNERQHPDPASLFAGVILSLPENVTIRELAFNLESPFQIIIKGSVEADSPELLKSALSKMVEALIRYLKPVRSPSMSDISFDMGKGDSESSSPGYRFNMQVDLK